MRRTAACQAWDSDWHEGGEGHVNGVGGPYRDRLAVLAAGEVVEAGTHDELLARDGTYAALWRVQTGEVADDDLPERVTG